MSQVSHVSFQMTSVQLLGLLFHPAAEGWFRHPLHDAESAGPSASYWRGRDEAQTPVAWDGRGRRHSVGAPPSADLVGLENGAGRMELNEMAVASPRISRLLLRPEIELLLNAVLPPPIRAATTGFARSSRQRLTGRI